MESKRSRTIVSTTITTEPSSNEDSPSTEALQHQINDLTHQISLLQSKTDEIAQMVRTIRAPGQDVHRRDDPADGPLALKHLNRPVQACNCQCTSHDARPNTIGGGVYLGLVRAGDVLQLGDRMLKELDDGLRAIAVRFFPRGVSVSRFTEEGQAMVALLNKVSLRQDAVPTVDVDYYARYQDPCRGRYERAAAGRYNYLNRLPESRLNAFYYETFLQLVLFRGIDLEALE